MLWKNLLTLAAVLAISAGLSACSDDDDDNGMNPPVQTAQIRAVHSSPDAPAVDIYIENVGIVAADVAYGETTPYLTVDAGTYNVQLRPAGADSSTDPIYETGEVSLAADAVLTAVAAGRLSSADAADSFRIIPLFESFATPAAGNAIVRILHAGPDAPTVDLDVGNDGSNEIMDLARFADTGASGVDLPAGSPLTIGVVADGATVTTFTTPALSAGTEYFIIATGLLAQSDISAADAFKLLAVDENGTSAFIQQSDPDAGSAMLRAVHASPDAPAVDVYAEGISVPLISALAYGDASLYFPVPAGTYNIQLRAHPSTEADPIAFETGPIDLAANQKITAVASGFLGSMDEADRFRILPLVEDFGTPQSALVRIVHAGPDAPSVDIDLGDDGSVDYGDLARFADTGAAGITLPSGEALQVGIRVAGGDRVTAFTTPALPDGEEIFVIATGSLARPARADDGFSLLAVASTGSLGFIKQNPVVYALHGSPDAPAVDIYAGESLLVQDLAFGELSGTVQVPPGTYTLDFFVTGTGGGSPAASFDTPELMAGSAYLAVAAGELQLEGTEEAFTLLAFEELFDPTETARVRAIHASGDAPAVDIGTVDGGTGEIDAVLFQNLAWSESSDDAGLEAPVGDLTIGVAATGSTTPVATFDITTEAGLQTFAIAAGALAPDGVEEAFRLILVVVSTNPWVGAEVLPD
ncbi:MAG: DUF4397 domain-containing protein [Candidatus Palauibacterales bacterium]|nr:DUF4397 domain-containing protein [Candidatus Palauibacterales bacterium]MDP2482698.1 DUF4397 domain-containing protein [Candidatus Palauibacterales bacterium]